MSRLWTCAALAAAVGAGLMMGQAMADQPKMSSALEHLRAARADLQDATNDKGGHRLKAIGLVDKAIAQVERGMRFDRRN